MAEGMELGWTSFPDHLPKGYVEPARMKFRPFHAEILAVLEQHIHGWNMQVECMNDILDILAEHVEIVDRNVKFCNICRVATVPIGVHACEVCE